ncbi:MAG: cytochrome bc1 complex diheme cytochrome c subunit [Acidimicrobiales bacterium]
MDVDVWRKLLANRYLLPAVVLGAVGVGSMFALPTSAGAQTVYHSTSSQITIGATFQTLIRDARSCHQEAARISHPGPPNTGSPKGSNRVTCVNGRIVSYGNAAITYKSLPRSYIAVGESLFEENCSSCHLADGQGGPAAPSLIGVGPATVTLWVSTGLMPAATPLTTQAQPKPTKITAHQAQEIAAFITSLAPAAPFVPSVNVKAANLAEGASLFALNCAACHTITGAGDELAFGTNALSLHSQTSTQVAEAIRTGPANMPVFSGNLSDAQVRDIVAYVTEHIKHPTNPGGAGLGGVGPVAEGFVALLFGVGGFMLVCYWIGDRA